MIWNFLELINCPHEYAAHVNRKGEIVVEPLADLVARGARVVGLPRDGSRGSPSKVSGSPIPSDAARNASDDN